MKTSTSLTGGGKVTRQKRRRMLVALVLTGALAAPTMSIAPYASIAYAQTNTTQQAATSNPALRTEDRTSQKVGQTLVWSAQATNTTGQFPWDVNLYQAAVEANNGPLVGLPANRGHVVKRL